MRKRKEMDAAAAAANADTDRLRLNNQVIGEQGDLYTELWRACAGGNVYIPRCGEKVFYFPQGHLEQVAVFTQDQHDSHRELPVHNLPSKILCRVSCVQLKAEAYTDEVFAQLILIPEPQQHELSLHDEDTDQIPCETTPYTSFIKILTPSDTSTHGGLSVPKRHADECFRPLDMTQQTPAAEIIAKDVHGFEWHFRHIYRGQPKRHLITSGWSTFVSSKRLVAGDSCIFVCGENGEIHVGIRRAVKYHGNAFPSSSLISGLSMKLGILANVEHAVTSGCMFTVYYHPWKYPNQFVVPLRHYLKSTTVDYPIGMRVQNKYEIHESARRYPGTVVGYEDIDHIRWPGSKWRCLKVQWDNLLDNRHPERVCPWWIEPMDPANEKHDPVLPAPKKAHVFNHRPLPGLSGFAMDDVQNSAKPASQTQRMDRDLQGQDFNCIQRPPSTDVIRPSKVSFGGSRFGRENPSQFALLMQDPLRKCLGRSMPFAHEDMSISSSNLSSIGSESLEWPPECRNEDDVPFGQPGSCSTSRYKLFGVSLIDSQHQLPSQQFAFRKTCKCRSVNNRTCTKVLKLGTALGRAVDLTGFPGYDELIAELDSMFDFGGSLINGSSGWHVTCIDDDGDMTLLGDYPWLDFQYLVQKMIICPKDDVNNLNPSSSANPPSL